MKFFDHEGLAIIHARDITSADFDRIVAELVQVSHQDGGDLEVISGHHDDHGIVVLIRDGSRHVVLTERASAASMVNRPFTNTRHGRCGPE